jgi:predicted O-methyltransferase YrrM
MSGYGWELEQVVKEIRRAEVIVEIGTHRGGSLRVWRKEYDPQLLVGIDPSDQDTPAGWTTPETAAELGVFMIRRESQDPVTIPLLMEVLDGRVIDLLFIDGDHFYDVVRKDFWAYLPLVSPDGVVVLDDAVRVDTERDEGVQYLYGEIRNVKRTKLVYDGHGGTGLAMVWP